MRPIGAIILILFVAPSLSAQFGTGPQLAIVSGGARIVDRDPTSTASNCSGWSYAPTAVLDDHGELAEIYTIEDQITNHCDPDLLSPRRFGDTVWRHVRKADGQWTGSDGGPVLSRSNLPWMQDRDYLLAHPEAYVGHLASPAVVRRDGRYFMAFAASVSDPNLCAGEHADLSGCGSCSDPWSYFVVMWATSDDGVHWSVANRDATAANRAIGAAVIWHVPDTADVKGGFKGITRLSMFAAEEDGQRWFYLAVAYWAGFRQIPALFRFAYDPASPSGIRGDPQLHQVSGGTVTSWINCPFGAVPPELTDPLKNSLGLGFFALSSIAPITSLPPYRYIATELNGPFGALGDKPAARVVYELTTDLGHWTAGQPLLSTITHFADNLTYPSAVIDPILFEDGSGMLHLLVSSADGDPTNGVPRDGTDTCDTRGFGTTSPFVGTGVYEAVVTPVSGLTGTTTTAQAVMSSGGVVTGLHIHVVATGSTAMLPSGTATVMIDSVFPGYWASVPILDGVGEAPLFARPAGTYRVRVSFTSYGLWSGSSADLGNLPVGPPGRRRATEQ
jgi:hypothetical protein